MTPNPLYSIQFIVIIDSIGNPTVTHDTGCIFSESQNQNRLANNYVISDYVTWKKYNECVVIRLKTMNNYANECDYKYTVNPESLSN